LEYVVEGAKKLVTSCEGYLWWCENNDIINNTDHQHDECSNTMPNAIMRSIGNNSKTFGNKKWKKHYFALSNQWLFYFEEQFHCNKFKSITFFTEQFFQQVFRLWVKGVIPLDTASINEVKPIKKTEIEMKIMIRIMATPLLQMKLPNNVVLS